MEIENEFARKDRLLDLFYALEESERKEMTELKRSGTPTRYDRMFRGVAKVTAIRPDIIRLERENGKIIKAFTINPEIAKLLKNGDHLMMIAGRRQGIWRLIRLDCMGSHIEMNGQPSMHMSVMNRSGHPSALN